MITNLFDKTTYVETMPYMNIFKMYNVYKYISKGLGKLAKQIQSSIFKIIKIFDKHCTDPKKLNIDSIIKKIKEGL